ncbi:NAD-dependent epimerase/dehydratase family protein [uncultured Prochlorococcus sp.]|uniref:NAD-dependent epimerase/dehydratase family protein n=1 Tax=uncultured Prochlorococcus sp. TaxID=159733 RepID=UPI00258F1E88|nr:NAD-dependent epimerase/dehydratase family protein [uncultured Prochlorococcus sp.]
MNASRPTILILGASSFLTKSLVKQLVGINKFQIICQSRKNLEGLYGNNESRIIYLRINYSNNNYPSEIFKNCTYIINLVNASSLSYKQLTNFRRFLKHVIFISKADLIHLSTASVYGKNMNKIITELSKCNPKNDYQKNKLKDEIEIKKIAEYFDIRFYILRPTEIVGDKSLNAKKFINNYKSSSLIKKYFLKSIYKKRLSHFVSSNFLIQNIIKIIEGKITEGIYIVSQDNESLNSFFEILKVIDSKLYPKIKANNFNFYLPLWLLFSFFYMIFRSNQVSIKSRFISKNPIIDPHNYFNFNNDFLEHIDYVLKK